MHRNIYFFSFFLICLILSGCERQWTGDIEGKITITDTTTPIPNVLISAYSVKNEYAITAVSDADGYYKINDVRWGPNKVNAYCPGYGIATKYADVIRNKAVTLDFELDEDTEYVIPEVTFLVTDPSENPIFQARLNSYHKLGTEYSFYGTQLTDEFGQTVFTLNSIVADQIDIYRVEISAYGFKSQKIDFAVTWNEYEYTLPVKMEPGM